VRPGPDPFLDKDGNDVRTSFQMWIEWRIPARSPKINEIRAIAIMIGIAARIRASSGTNISATSVSIGVIDSDRLPALAYWTRVRRDTPVTARMRNFAPWTFSLKASKNAMKDNGRLGFK